ncbi:MAG: leucine-rich repeat protein [Paludibacteraceae bacterium]|nr:leucine-rich repeat protein [Paludibacteraceae bacterium]
MKQKFLFWVALATMLVTGRLFASSPYTSLSVLGASLELKDGTTKVGNITIEQDIAGKVLQIRFGSFPNQRLDVPSDVSLIDFKSNESYFVLIGFDESLEINHGLEDKKALFRFNGKEGSDPMEVYLANNSTTEDVTLTINGTTETMNADVFSLVETHLHLNTLDLMEISGKLHKLNFDISHASNYIFSMGSLNPSYVDLGYGDYHFAFTNTEKKGDVFDGNIVVSGLGRLNTYDERNYVTNPQGLGFYLNGVQAGLYKCDATLTSPNRYMGEVTLTYAPTNWQYFGPGDYSSWRLQESCEGGVILQATCSGDLSSLESEDLPWMPFKDIITRVELQEDVMYPCDKLPKETFRDFTALTSASLSGISGLKEIPDGLFWGCEKLTEVTFPTITEGIESIGDHAFWMCKKLTTMELPETIEEIGDFAFYSCVNLDVTLPKSLKKVGYRAFDQCNTVTMPKEIGENVETVKENEEGQWASVFRIVRLVFPGTMEEWLARDNEWIMGAWTNYTSDGGYLNIGGEDIVDLVIPNGTTELKPYAFANAVQIKTVTFPSTLTKIEGRAFYECKKLEAANLPDNITELGDECFAYSGIETLTLPKGLTVIPKEAFSFCENLESLNLPEGLLGIGVEAFYGCEALQTLVLPNSVTTIAPAAFAGSGLKEVTLPKSLNYIEISAFGSCLFLTTVNIPAGMGDVEFDMSSLNGLTIDELSDEEKMVLGFAFVTDIRFGGDMNEWLSKSRPWLMENLSATIPDFINEIYVPHEVNLYLSGSDEPLQEAVVPEGVTAIPEDAFHMTTLASLTLPASIKEIGARAFEGCKNIQNAYIYAWNPPTLGKDAFEGINGFFTPWYTARHNYEKAEGWGTYVSSQLDYSFWPAPMRDDYVQVTVKEGQEAFGSVSLNVPEEHRTGGYESETELTVMEGGDITVVAEPAEGYRFVRWERWLYNGAMIASDWEEVSNEASYTTQAQGIPLGGSTQNTFRAVFEQAKGSFDISVTVKGIDPELVEITGAGTYTEGDNATLSFTLKDDEHYSFSMWLFDENNFRTTQTLSFENIDANHDVEIVFNVNKYTVTATVIPAGAGVVKGQGEYDYGTDYTLTLEPAEGWVLKEWRDGIALDEKSNTLTGTVYGAINIEVELVQNIVTYNVTFLDWDATVLFVEKVEEGKDAKGPDTNPEREGYTFIGWAPDITNVTSDRTVIAQYEKKDATGLGDVQGDNVQCTKVLRDGVLYIMYNGTMYNVQGQRLR